MENYLQSRVDLKCLTKNIEASGEREVLQKWRNYADSIKGEKTKEIEHLYKSFSNFSDLQLQENDFHLIVVFLNALLKKINESEREKLIKSIAENCLIKLKIHTCPICNKELRFVERYPNYICGTCVAKSVDEDGKELSFCNIDMGGGFIALYAKTNIKRNSHICFINNLKCIADEARFGGIVVQPFSSFSRKGKEYYLDIENNNA